jgi:hypothetical protein
MSGLRLALGHEIDGRHTMAGVTWSETLENRLNSKSYELKGEQQTMAGEASKDK